MARAVLVGLAGSPGLGVGRVLVVPVPSDGGNGAGPSAPAPGQADPAAEAARLLAALERAACDLEALATSTAAVAGQEVGAIFEAQALFARDPGLVKPALAAIRDGASAVAAIRSAASSQADVLAEVDDAYFRERAADIRDIGRRVADLLEGREARDLWHADGTPAVVVAADLDPSVVATLRRELVAGLAFAGGAPTGHAAIVARALGLPLVLGLGEEAAGVRSGSAAAVDGSAGQLVLEPSEAELASLRASAAAAAVPSRVLAGATALPVAVAANVSSAIEAEAAARAGADGIGLVRTELLFLGRSSPPSVAEQRALYAAIRAAIAPLRVVFRTLDIGGDKPASWRGESGEPNPALGVRGVRLGLREPGLLEDQLRALAEAAAGGPLEVMLPMVSVPAELSAARGRLEQVLAGLAGDGRPTPVSVSLGAMIEVPAAAIVADGLAPHADFFSIGTNDLVQYALAADRTNPALAELASPLQPAVLRLIAGVVAAARRFGRPVAICGEAAADTRVIPLFVGLGVDELSVAPGSIARVRGVVASVDVESARRLAANAIGATTLAEVERLVEAG